MTKSTSKVDFNFKRDRKAYRAVVEVKHEADKPTYKLHAEIFTDKGKKIFEKDRSELTHLQVEPAIVFAFHQAFAQ